MAAKKKAEKVVKPITKEEQDALMTEAEKEKLLDRHEQAMQLGTIGLVTDTPYLGSPNINSNVVGILKAGATYPICGEINDSEKGNFWDIGGGRFINKDWDVAVFRK